MYGPTPSDIRASSLLGQSEAKVQNEANFAKMIGQVGIRRARGSRLNMRTLEVVLTEAVSQLDDSKMPR